MTKDMQDQLHVADFKIILELERIPNMCSAQFCTASDIFERYSRTEKALVNVIIESYLQGVSTRNVENVISHLGVNQLSAFYVSKVAQELDVKVNEFMERT
jgi:transposase-like protein